MRWVLCFVGSISGIRIGLGVCCILGSKRSRRGFGLFCCDVLEGGRRLCMWCFVLGCGL